MRSSNLRVNSFLLVRVVIALGFFGGLTLMLGACSLEAAIIRPQAEIEAIFQSKATVKEVVPVSQQGIVTSAGFRVQSSVNFINGAHEIQTKDKYKVRGSVQSMMFKE